METKPNWYSRAALCIGVAAFFAAFGSLGLLVGYLPNLVAKFGIETEVLMATALVGTLAVISSVLLPSKPKRFWLPTLLLGVTLAVLGFTLFGLRTPLAWVSVAGVAMIVIGRQKGTDDG